MEITYPLAGIAIGVSAGGPRGSRVVTSRVDGVRDAGGAILSGSVERRADGGFEIGGVAIDGLTAEDAAPGGWRSTP